MSPPSSSARPAASLGGDESLSGDVVPNLPMTGLPSLLGSLADPT